MSHQTWGGRFKKPLDPAVVKFNASLAFDHILYQHDIAGSKAHANMLARQGLLSFEEAQTIEQALTAIELEIQQGQHALDEHCEDIHMFIEQLLIAKIGDVGKKLHTGRSRNDQVALDLRLYSREAGGQISQLLTTLNQVLQKLAQKHATIKMPGYTHLQQAQPIFLGQYFAAYQAMFSRDLDRLQDWHQRMNFSPLGAGALAGSQLPLDRHWVAQTLGFSSIIDNTLDAVSDRDFIIEFCSAASLIMMHLSRLAEDLILWATQEFNFIRLDDGFATGSSLMPNKKNPDVLELIRGKSGRVFGHLMGLLTLMKALPLAYNKDMQEDKESLFDTVNTLKTCLSILSPFLQSLQFNTDLMQQKAHAGYLDATAVLESLVLTGMPFRDAHHQVGSWVSEAMERNCSLSELLAVKNHPLALKKPTTPSQPVKHILTGLELSCDELDYILNLALHMKQRPESYQTALANKSLVMLFEKPSLRTRLSFSLAIQALGGIAIESLANTRKREEPRDVARVLQSYCDFIMVRTHEDSLLQEMAAYSQVPIINGLSALHHPCQILADLLTLKEHFNHLEGLTLAYIGDGNNILHSLLLLAPQLGIHIHYCCPKSNQPNASIVTQAFTAGDPLIQSYSTPQEAVQQADAVYTDVWTSMGFEEQSDEAQFVDYQINEELMAQAKPEAIFMHCMPMVRGKEVSSTLPDQPTAALFKQSENRLHVQKALLYFLQYGMPGNSQ